MSAEDKLMWKFTAFAGTILVAVMALALWTAYNLP